MDYAMKQTMQKNAKKYKNLSLECMEYLAKTWLKLWIGIQEMTVDEQIGQRSETWRNWREGREPKQEGVGL